MAQKLRVLLLNAPSILPPGLLPILGVYEKKFNVDIRGTLLQDRRTSVDAFLVTIPWSSEKAVQPPVEVFAYLRDLFKERVIGKIIRQNKIQRFGQAFQPSRRAPGNSQIIFTSARGGCKVICAGRIREIFTYSPDNVQISIFLLVDEFLKLSPHEKVHDHARHFKDFGAKLYHTGTQRCLIPAENIVCHFASIVRSVEGIDGECVFVLPLRRK